MKRSQILREAKKHLPQKKFVCYALDHIQETSFNPITKWKVRSLKAQITQSLCRRSSVIGWLDAMHGIMIWKGEEQLVYRLAWMDNMIAYWESKGD